jgi:hypothetical protein
MIVIVPRIVIPPKASSSRRRLGPMDDDVGIASILAGVTVSR